MYIYMYSNGCVYIFTSCVCVYIYMQVERVYMSGNVYLHKFTLRLLVCVYVFAYVHAEPTWVCIYIYTYMHAECAHVHVYSYVYACQVDMCVCIFRQKFQNPKSQIYMYLTSIDPQARVLNYCVT